jgi:3-methyladenine DNA glycosylase AlkD
MVDRLQYLNNLENSLRACSDEFVAKGQKAYMRNQFEFLGVKSPERKAIQKPFFERKSKPHKSDLSFVVQTLWQMEEREFQYAAQELYAKYLKESDSDDIALFEWMILTKSWWDTVDFIASNLVGNYFKKHPDQIEPTIEKWLHSGNIWLQRSILLFQLKYKKEVDADLLAGIIHSLLGTGEFFIDKAIGWSLREYSKVNPDWVRDFVNRTELSNISRREGLKVLDRS